MSIKFIVRVISGGYLLLKKTFWREKYRNDLEALCDELVVQNSSSEAQEIKTAIRTHNIYFFQYVPFAYCRTMLS